MMRPESDHSNISFLQCLGSESSLTTEYNIFISQQIPGIYCIPGSKLPNEWFGVLFLRQGPYQGGIFRFTLHIPPNYRVNKDYKIIFEQPVFHPLIDPETKTLDASVAYLDKPNDSRVYHALVYAQQVFFDVTVEHAVNTEAANLFTSDVPQFLEKAAESVMRSREVVYDAAQVCDQHAIRFTPWDQSVHQAVRDEILKRNTNADDGVRGFSSSLKSGISFIDAKRVFRL